MGEKKNGGVGGKKPRENARSQLVTAGGWGGRLVPASQPPALAAYRQVPDYGERSTASLCWKGLVGRDRANPTAAARPPSWSSVVRLMGGT